MFPCRCPFDEMLIEAKACWGYDNREHRTSPCVTPCVSGRIGSHIKTAGEKPSGVRALRLKTPNPQKDCSVFWTVHRLAKPWLARWFHRV